ncbi:ABC transporter ATP-binding protein [Euzebya tangerina]|uniref:ABC transporter ATP-binding protein n=1 Tax=Euzebya tangerina TaxID=591198 RepID=UPI0013C2E4AC|nr:ABC transporter ATP-binding protein [Euzebya tangerina]
MSSLLTVTQLRRTYGTAVALDGLDLHLDAGECVALLGHNGSGKTTALTAIAGLVPPTSGTVRVTGADPFTEPEATTARRALAYVSDSPVFYADMTVEEHIELTAVGHGLGERLDEDTFDRRLGQIIDQFGLDAHRDHVPEELSAGLQQRTQLACAFIRPFKVLVLDEPVLRLDPAAQSLLAHRLDRTRNRGAAVLLSTHSPAFARQLADRVVLLEHGHVVAEGDWDVIDASPEAAELGLT